MNITAIEEKLLFTTVRIESLDNKGYPVSIGTGFIITKKLVDNGNKAYIVSNKHVLLASNQFRIKFTKKKQSCNKPELGKIISFRFLYSDTFIELHPDKDIDVAIIDITDFIMKYNDDIFCKAFDYSMLANCEEDYLHIAQNTIFIGYPDNRYDIQSNLPLVRSAIVASHPSLNFNGLEAFIVDGQVFPGSSGSPVLINPYKEKWINVGIPDHEPHIQILGIIAQTMIRNSKLQVLDTKQIDNAHVQEVLGLGIVFRSTVIKEVLDLATNKFFDSSTNDTLGMICFKEN